MKTVLIILAVLALLFLIIYLVIRKVYRMTFYNGKCGKRRDQTYDLLKGPGYDPYTETVRAKIDRDRALSFEPVYTTSFDGLKLYGRLYIKDPKAPFHILFHGYKGTGYRDMSGWTGDLLLRGHNVLLVDQRAHGKSEGSSITFGVKERYDVLSWVNYLINDCPHAGTGCRIILSGKSMGAASVIMAAGLDLPENVKGIACDCPYSSPIHILEKESAERTGVKEGSKAAEILLALIIIAACEFAKFSLTEYDAEKGAGDSKLPILIIHGTADTYVPIEMSRRIKNAAPGKVTLVEIENAPHLYCYETDSKTYLKAYDEFLEKVLTPRQVC